jgi:HEPN domain-containing protein
LYEDLCFDAQQAAEKALKAVLVQCQVAFPKTHAIADLLTLLQQAGTPAPPDVEVASILTGYAVDARYPGLSEPVTAEDYREAVEIADRVVQWAASMITVR